MYYLDPMSGNRPGDQHKARQPEQRPSKSNSSLWVLCTMAGAVGIVAVLVAI
jgi:hypothetical protein